MHATSVADIELKEAEAAARSARRAKARSLFAPGTVGPSLKQAFVMLRPDIQWSNPVMFVVEVGAILTLGFIAESAFGGGSASQTPLSYFIALDAWLFATVLFANFATALAEARGKAQAESLRKARFDTMATRVTTTGVETVSSSVLKQGDRVIVKEGETIPGDGEIIEGIASVDESAIT